jgi:hypothetical protein
MHRNNSLGAGTGHEASAGVGLAETDVKPEGAMVKLRAHGIVGEAIWRRADLDRNGSQRAREKWQN